MTHVAATNLPPEMLSWAILIAVFASLALALFCVFTIHRNPYFNELQKIGWLLLALGLPIFGPIAWFSRAHHEKKVRSDPEKYGVQETPSVADYAAKLVPVHGDKSSDSFSTYTASSGASQGGSVSAGVASLTGSQTHGKTTRFAPSSDFAQQAETADSASNPHLSEGEDGGPRVLRF